MGKCSRSKSNYRNADAATCFFKVLFNRNRNIKVNLTVWEKYFTDFLETCVEKACCFFMHRNLIEKR